MGDIGLIFWLLMHHVMRARAFKDTGCEPRTGSTVDALFDGEQWTAEESEYYDAEQLR